MAKGIDTKGVCKLIADTKKEKGYTNARLSELSGVPKFTVGAYTKAARTPTLQNLQKLCSALGLDAEQVARDYGYYPEPRKKKIIAEKPAVEVKEEDTTMPVNTVEAVDAVKTNDAKSEYKATRTGVDKAHKEMFGKWLATLIVKSGFSQIEYGELIDISDRVIYTYCRGLSMPTLFTLQKICKLHNVDWKVAACYFGYKDYKVPSYWLGDDYKVNEDWNAIDNIVKADFGVTTRSLQRAIERQSIKKTAAAPAVDISEYTNRIAELERQLGEAKKETASALADAHDIKKEYEGRWEVKLANIRKELEGKYNARIEELEASNANLQADLAKAPATTKADMYVVAVENHLRDLLPKAKTVVVSCTSGELYWDVELPGLESSLFNGEITAEDFAQAIHKNLTEAAMTAIGLN